MGVAIWDLVQADMQQLAQWAFGERVVAAWKIGVSPSPWVKRPLPRTHRRSGLLPRDRGEGAAQLIAAVPAVGYELDEAWTEMLRWFDRGV